MGTELYDIKLKTIDGKDASLADYKGGVVLVVNVASACGLTPQYGGLEKIYETYIDRGFNVLGFPAMISARRSRAPKLRSRPSARRVSMCNSRCSAK